MAPIWARMCALVGVAVTNSLPRGVDVGLTCVELVGMGIVYGPRCQIDEWADVDFFFPKGLSLLVVALAAVAPVLQKKKAVAPCYHC